MASMRFGLNFAINGTYNFWLIQKTLMCTGKLMVHMLILTDPEVVVPTCKIAQFSNRDIGTLNQNFAEFVNAKLFVPVVPKDDKPRKRHEEVDRLKY